MTVWGEYDEGTPMGRVVAGVCVLATASVGMLATGTAGAADPGDQFDNLKPIKAPSPCKNDTGVDRRDDQDRRRSSRRPGRSRFFYAQALDGIKARVAQGQRRG